MVILTPMSLGFITIAGLGGYILYTAFNSKNTMPQPTDGNKEQTALPPPRFLYSDPKIWTSAPGDINYRPSRSFYGPNNDPRKAFLLHGGARVVHSGYVSAATTNQTWPETSPSEPASRPMYTPKPVIATGEHQRVTSKTVFT